MSFYLLILAHVLADFPFQFKSILQDKCSGRLKGYLWHMLIHFTFMLILTFPYIFSLRAILPLIIITLSHGMLDFIKNSLKKLVLPSTELFLFLFDQFIHIILIFFIWDLASFFSKPYILPYSSRLQTLFSLYGFHIVTGLIVYTYVIFGGSVLVRKVLDLPSIGLPLDDNNQRAAGRYIGMVERALLVTLVWADSLGSVAFVLAAKSIARYKDLEDKAFAEYYLVGTLTSSLVGVVGGLILRSLSQLR